MGRWGKDTDPEGAARLQPRSGSRAGQGPLLPAGGPDLPPPRCQDASSLNLSCLCRDALSFLSPLLLSLVSLQPISLWPSDLSYHLELAPDLGRNQIQGQGWGRRDGMSNLQRLFSYLISHHYPLLSTQTNPAKEVPLHPFYW